MKIEAHYKQEIYLISIKPSQEAIANFQKAIGRESKLVPSGLLSRFNFAVRLSSLETVKMRSKGYKIRRMTKKDDPHSMIKKRFK